jgi:hypothetical protein
MANLDQRQLGSYAPSEVVVIISKPDIGFTHQVVGYSEDSFIQLTRDVESWTLTTGADGMATRTHAINESGKVTLDLMSVSVSNDILSALWNRDKQFKNNSGLFSILVKDNSGRSVARSDSAFISTFPDQTYGSGAGSLQWVISAANLERYIGGNSLVSGDAVDAMAALERSIDDQWQL